MIPAIIVVAALMAPTAEILASSPTPSQEPPPRPVRVLMLYSHDRDAPAVARFTDELQAVVRADDAKFVTFSNELLDLHRFPDRGRWPELTRDIAEKYADARFDAIVVEGAHGLLLVTEHLRALFPGVPVVYGLAYEPVVDFDALPPDVVGRRQSMPFVSTYELARGLHPDAERVVIVSGSAPTDSLLLRVAIDQLTPLADGLEITPLENWSHPELLSALKHMPPRTIVILSSFSRDWQGQVFNSGDLIASISTIASTPVYGIAHNWVGDGIVGGGVMFGNEGADVGRMLLRVLDHDPQIRPEIAPTPRVVDWRQLQRWSLDEQRLPEGTEVLFRPPTLWERYRVVAFVIGAVIFAQSLMIGMLLVERAKRIRAQWAAAQSQGQVTHLARVAVVGELAAAVSHELRQPLTAIRTHAEAGALLLAQARPDVAVAREIFQDIVQDNLRAADVIEHMRLLLRKDPPAHASVDLNAVCARAIRLLEHEAHNRRARIDLTLDPRLPMVTGDAVQLQQAVLNLAFNALDALTTTASERTVTVGTAMGNHGSKGQVIVFIRDTGPGLAPDVQPHLFEPFFSTKAHGLGMGLAIVRLIVERHDGRVVAGNSPAGGALFRVLLPAA